MSVTLLPWMREYADLGLCLIPLTRKKVPLVNWKQEGFQNRTPSENELGSWLEKFPECNWAVVCGRVSGHFFGLDFDSPENYAKFFGSHEQLEKNTTVVRTSRGIHVWGICDPPVRKFDVGPGKSRLVEVHGEGSLTSPALGNGPTRTRLRSRCLNFS
jgi:hypothetical protein